MNTLENAKALNEALLSGNEDYWQAVSEDVVKRITGWKDLVGLEACQRQWQEFVDGLSANRLELRSLAVEEEDEVSFAEYCHEFKHRRWGHQCQTQIHVQRWRDGKVYEETIYVTPLDQSDGI